MILPLEVLFLLGLLEYDYGSAGGLFHFPLQLPIAVVGCDVHRHLLLKFGGFVIQLVVLHTEVTIQKLGERLFTICRSVQRKELSDIYRQPLFFEFGCHHIETTGSINILKEEGVPTDDIAFFCDLLFD